MGKMYFISDLMTITGLVRDTSEEGNERVSIVGEEIGNTRSYKTIFYRAKAVPAYVRVGMKCIVTGIVLSTKNGYSGHIKYILIGNHIYAPNKVGVIPVSTGEQKGNEGDE